MLNSIGERTEPCGTPFFSLLSLLRCPSLVCTTKLRFYNISIMKPTMCLSGMILYKQFQVKSSVPHGVICSCQVQKHFPSFLIVLKAVFDVLR